jgi:nucleotide-binding universal stress UspA family protein
LLVIGSHGRSAIGRFFLGSVSKEVAETADRAIRVVRPNPGRDEGTPNRLLIGANTLPDMEKVLNAVGKRVWRGRTEISLIAVDDGVSARRVSAVYPYGKAIFEQAAEGRLAEDIPVTVDVRSGDLKSVLLDEAENRNADSIFIIAKARDSGPGLDETATHLITGAGCTVELVR